MATAHHLAVLRIVTSQSKGIRAQERTGVLGHRETDRQAPIGAKGPGARRRDAATPARVGRRFPSIRWVKLYGSRALGRQRPGSDIDLAFGSPDDCSAALAGAFKELPIPYTVDVTHGGSLEHEGLRRLCSVRRGGAGRTPRRFRLSRKTLQELITS